MTKKCEAFAEPFAGRYSTEIMKFLSLILGTAAFLAGFAVAADYTNPIRMNGPDPFIVYDNGMFFKVPHLKRHKFDIGFLSKAIITLPPLPTSISKSLVPQHFGVLPVVNARRRTAHQRPLPAWTLGRPRCTRSTERKRLDRKGRISTPR